MSSLADKLTYASDAIEETWKEIETRVDNGEDIDISDNDIARIPDIIKTRPYVYPFQNKTASPSRLTTYVQADENQTLHTVTVPGAPALQPQNIRTDTEIYGVVGTLN